MAARNFTTLLTTLKERKGIMKFNQDVLERLVAVGLVVLGVVLNNYIIAGIGIAYFLIKM